MFPSPTYICIFCRSSRFFSLYLRAASLLSARRRSVSSSTEGWKIQQSHQFLDFIWKPLVWRHVSWAFRGFQTPDRVLPGRVHSGPQSYQSSRLHQSPWPAASWATNWRASWASPFSRLSMRSPQRHVSCDPQNFKVHYLHFSRICKIKRSFRISGIFRKCKIVDN